MDRDIIQGNWKQLTGKLRARWGMLIGDPLGVVDGRRMQRSGERQWAYGVFRRKTLRKPA